MIWRILVRLEPATASSFGLLPLVLLKESVPSSEQNAELELRDGCTTDLRIEPDHLLINNQGAQQMNANGKVALITLSSSTRLREGWQKPW